MQATLIKIIYCTDIRFKFKQSPDIPRLEVESASSWLDQHKSNVQLALQTEMAKLMTKFDRQLSQIEEHINVVNMLVREPHQPQPSTFEKISFSLRSASNNLR